jgi:DNA-binding response OmpR family regulator
MNTIIGINISEKLYNYLVNAGFEVNLYRSDNLLSITFEQVSLFIVDDDACKPNTLKITKYIRSNSSNVPLILLALDHSETAELNAFDAGCDDYISSEASFAIILARVKALLRRNTNVMQTIDTADVLQFGEMKLVLSEKRAYINDKPIELTKREFDLLHLLLLKKNKTFSREELLLKLWDDVIVMDRTIDVNIKRLRSKLDEYGKHIVTRVGYGYSFNEAVD